MQLYLKAGVRDSEEVLAQFIIDSDLSLTSLTTDRLLETMQLLSVV